MILMLERFFDENSSIIYTLNTYIIDKFDVFKDSPYNSNINDDTTSSNKGDVD